MIDTAPHRARWTRSTPSPQWTANTVAVSSRIATSTLPQTSSSIWARSPIRDAVVITIPDGGDRHTTNSADAEPVAPAHPLTVEVGADGILRFTLPAPRLGAPDRAPDRLIPKDIVTTFSLGETDFLLDGRPHQVISGTLHYFRIHPEHWPTASAPPRRWASTRSRPTSRGTRTSR